MCLACCDPAKLAQVAKAERPNNVDIPASGFITVTTQGDALVRLVSAGHYAGSTLTLVPTGSNLTSCTWRKQGSSGLFIPGPGNWTIYNAGLSSVQVEIFTAYCGAAFAAYAQTGYEAPVHSAPTLDATPLSTLVLAANRQRAYALFVNDSSSVVYLSFGPAAAANMGIRLNANGGSYEMEGNTLWRGVVNAIQVGTTAAQKILVTEGT
jgi:hypothetical protein